MLQIGDYQKILHVAFTTDFYRRAFHGWQLGRLTDVFGLIESAELDPFIAGCLEARSAGYTRSYQIRPASKDAKDVAAAEFVQHVFDNLTMDEFFEYIIDSKLKQYSVIGLEWNIVDGKQVITGFEKYEQKYFAIDRKDKNTVKIDKNGTLITIDPDAALVTKYYKNMILFTILKIFIRKTFGEESWSSFLEIFGEPFIWAEYPPTMQTDDKEKLREDLENLGASARGVVPKGTQINFSESQRNTGDHKEYETNIEFQISLALLGHGKAAGTMQSGLQVGGDNNPFKVSQHIAIKDMKYIEQSIKPLIRMLVSRNFPNISSFPRLVFDKSPAVETKDKLAALTIALNAGAQVSPEIFDDLGIPLMDKTAPIQKQPLFPGDNAI